MVGFTQARTIGNGTGTRNGTAFRNAFVGPDGRFSPLRNLLVRSYLGRLKDEAARTPGAPAVFAHRLGRIGHSSKREALALLLGEFAGDAKVREALESVARTDADARIRLRAKESLQRNRAVEIVLDNLREDVFKALGGRESEIVRALRGKRLGSFTPADVFEVVHALKSNKDAFALVSELFFGITNGESKLAPLLELLAEDLDAIYAKDPAARNRNEIALCYPGLRATAVHRVAHYLYERRIPILPRLLNEHIHSKTGIDINPGARIGRRFFIDHGTGVVIGETTEIGDGVLIYHGVTLGVASQVFGEDGSVVRGKKRHPTIGDDVVIGTGARVLGAIEIGKGTVIGANTVVISPVPPESIVVGFHSKSKPGIRGKELVIEPKNGEGFTAGDGK